LSSRYVVKRYRKFHEILIALAKEGIVSQSRIDDAMFADPPGQNRDGLIEQITLASCRLKTAKPAISSRFALSPGLSRVVDAWGSA